MANFRTVLHISRFSASSVAALALTAGVLAFGAGMANADPNDPAMTEVPPNGQLQSSGAARFSGGDRCVVNEGTLPTSVVRSFEQGSPNQIIEEAGPEWVGSRGWRAVGSNPAYPWGGSFNPRSAKTGPACGPVSPDRF